MLSGRGRESYLVADNTLRISQLAKHSSRVVMNALFALCCFGIMLTGVRGFSRSVLGSIVSRKQSSSAVSAFNNGLSDYAHSKGPDVTVGASMGLSYSGDLLVVPFYKPNMSEASDKASTEEQDRAMRSRR